MYVPAKLVLKKVRFAAEVVVVTAAGDPVHEYAYTVGIVRAGTTAEFKVTVPDWQ